MKKYIINIRSLCGYETKWFEKHLNTHGTSLVVAVVKIWTPTHGAWYLMSDGVNKIPPYDRPKKKKIFTTPQILVKKLHQFHPAPACYTVLLPVACCINWVVWKSRNCLPHLIRTQQGLSKLSLSSSLLLAFRLTTVCL